MSVDFYKNELLCMIVVNDELAEGIFGKELAATIPGFLRGWVLKNRETGQVWATWRFAYPDGNRSWANIKPTPESTQGPEADAIRLRCGLEDTFRKAGEVKGLLVEVSCFYPPAGLDDGQTKMWLLENDLIEMREQ